MSAAIELATDRSRRPRASAAVAHPHLTLVGLQAAKCETSTLRGQTSVTITFATDTPFDVECIESSGRRHILFKTIGHFPFLRLSPELRTIIYEMVFGWASQFTVERQEHGFVALPRQQHAVSLLQVNRQVYHESVPVLYTARPFTFETTHLLDKFLHRIGPSAKFLSDITISGRYIDMPPQTGFVRLIGATKLRRIHFSKDAFNQSASLAHLYPWAHYLRTGTRQVDEVAFRICQGMKPLFKAIDARAGRQGAFLEVLSLETGIVEGGEEKKQELLDLLKHMLAVS